MNRYSTEILLLTGAIILVALPRDQVVALLDEWEDDQWVPLPLFTQRLVENPPVYSFRVEHITAVGAETFYPSNVVPFKRDEAQPLQPEVE